jgi:hypothetical protein
MSASPDTPPKQGVDEEETSIVPGTPSSETQDEEPLQPPSILESPAQDEVHTDPPETAGDDSSILEKDSSSASTTDVPLMDWTEFESEYKKALVDANEVEDQLVLEFEKLSKVSAVWVTFKEVSNVS